MNQITGRSCWLWRELSKMRTRDRKSLESPFLPALAVLLTFFYVFWHLGLPQFNWNEHCGTCCLHQSFAWSQCCPGWLFSCVFYLLYCSVDSWGSERRLCAALDINLCGILQLMRSQCLLNECVNHNLVICLLLPSKDPGSIASLHQNIEVLASFQFHSSFQCPLHYLEWKMYFISWLDFIVKSTTVIFKKKTKFKHEILTSIAIKEDRGLNIGTVQ